MASRSPRYDQIGVGYTRTRREDPRTAARIVAALGDARTIVNVGAGTGSYEPRDRVVLAVEPSAQMAAQRPADRPAIRAFADALPFFDQSVDAAMTVLSLHHWDEARQRGLAEMRRVARGPVVIVTIDPVVSGATWMMAEYLPENAVLDHQILPTMAELASWLPGTTTVEVLPIHHDTPDWTLLSFWRHPERLLDPVARDGCSGVARMPPAAVARAVAQMERDLADGTWEARHGHLRALDEYDAGLRLVVNRP